MKLDLSSVTLCAIDHAAHDLTRLALQRCLDVADFADVVVLSDKDILPGARHVRTEVNEAMGAELLLVCALPAEIKTSHYLYVQWDSWIINPNVWTDDFLQYDYIGAPWPAEYTWPGCNPAHNVGNGGFSLRSVRLADALLEHKPVDELYSPEDHFLCVHARPVLEQAGMKWAPADVAEHFSAELRWPEFPTFGFHGAFHFGSVLTPDEFEQVLDLATPYVRSSKGFARLNDYVELACAREEPPSWAGPLKPGWVEWR